MLQQNVSDKSLKERHLNSYLYITSTIENLSLTIGRLNDISCFVSAIKMKYSVLICSYNIDKIHSVQLVLDLMQNGIQAIAELF